jgi:hypothetical protein
LVNWELIVKHQILSEEFIYRNADKINFYLLCSSDNIYHYSEKMQDFILIEIIDHIETIPTLLPAYIGQVGEEYGRTV